MIDFLYTNIGRGHPHYLDGIIECLPPQCVGRIGDVFASTGLSRLGWSAVRRVYRTAGRGGAVSSLYNRIRSGTNYDSHSGLLKVLGSGLAEFLSSGHGPLVVAHPLLVAIVGAQRRLFYQHGEVAVPNEALVQGAQRIFVPLSKTADGFLGARYSKDQVVVSGLCIEPTLVSRSEHAFDQRISRLQGTVPPCGAFFSSGAEPQIHVSSIADAALSAAKAGCRIIVFAAESGMLERRVRKSFDSGGQELVVMSGSDRRSPGQVASIMITYDSRAGLNDITVSHFADFDYFVAPSHERSNWALGLGLPLFVVDPPLGSFSPLNRQFLIDAGVAKPMRDRREASSFGSTLNELRRSGELQQMAEAGWQRYDIHGFENIASLLVSET